jgi:hypothetical protein
LNSCLENVGIFILEEEVFFCYTTLSGKMKNEESSRFSFDCIIAVYENWASGQDIHSIWLQHQDHMLCWAFRIVFGNTFAEDSILLNTVLTYAVGDWPYL